MNFTPDAARGPAVRRRVSSEIPCLRVMESKNSGHTMPTRARAVAYSRMRAAPSSFDTRAVLPAADALCRRERESASSRSMSRPQAEESPLRSPARRARSEDRNGAGAWNGVSHGYSARR